MIFIDCTESPYFFTMADIILDYEPLFAHDSPVTEQCNNPIKTDTVYDLKGRPVLTVVGEKRKTLLDRILQ